MGVNTDLRRMTSSTVEDIRDFFNARSIALIGASPNDSRIYPNIKKFFKGVVYPVNPKYSEVYGLKCYPDVKNLPPGVSCAAINLAREHVTGVLRSCGECGIRFAVIFATGFGEIDDAGRVTESQIREIAIKYGMTVVGPNSAGFVNTEGAAPCWFPSVPVPPSTKGIAIVSQSGGVMSYVYRYGIRRKMGFSYIVSTGNETVTKLTDFLRFLIADERTSIIVVAVEGIEDGRELRRLFQSAREAGKSIIVLKMGQSRKGNEAVSLHSGRLATDARMFRAMCAQAGVVWTEGIEQVLDTAEILLKLKPGARGSRVGVAMFSGGLSALVSDYAERLQLELPTPNADTRERLAKLLKVPRSGLTNPFDLQPLLLVSESSTVVRILDEDGNYDWILVRYPLFEQQVPEFYEQIKKAAQKSSIPIVCYTPIKSESIVPDDKVAVIGGAENALAAIGLVVNSFSGSAQSYEATNGRRARVGGMMGTGLQEGLLSFDTASMILREYGIESVKSETVESQRGASEAANRIGYPVVLKAEGLYHRTEASMVKTDIRNEGELSSAFNELAARQTSDNPAQRRLLVQKQEEGVEVIVGARVDPRIGPFVIYGIGGVLAEALGDPSIRLAPVNVETARSMINEVRGSVILDAFRGRSKADIQATAEAISNLSKLASDFEDVVSELDINPLFVFKEGQGVRAADIKISVRRLGVG